MIDPKKVIRGLKTCSSSGLLCHSNDCPYSDHSLTCKYVLMRDALALLKEQEPRVLTLEEVIHSKDWIWYEWENTYTGWAIALNCDEAWIEWNDNTTDPLCKYGKTWRCWSARPTDEQRKAVAWNG